MIRTSFDAFDSAAATTLVDDDRLLANLENAPRESPAAYRSRVQGHPGTRTSTHRPRSTGSSTAASGTGHHTEPAQLRRHSSSPCRSSTRWPELCIQHASRGSSSSRLFQHLMNKSVAMVSPTATAASLALAPTVASLSASPAAGAVADRVHLLNASLPLIPLTPRGGTMKPPHTPRQPKDKTPRADEAGSGEPFAKDAKI